MIDFSTLQSLTIPEGVVTKIEDASGNVLWNAAEMVTITFDSSRWYYGISYIVINGVTYSKPQSTVNVPVGTTITIDANVSGCDCGEEDGQKYLHIGTNTSPVSVLPASYTVTGNVTIAPYEVSPSCKECDERYRVARVYITET